MVGPPQGWLVDFKPAGGGGGGGGGGGAATVSFQVVVAFEKIWNTQISLRTRATATTSKGGQYTTEGVDNYEQPAPSVTTTNSPTDQ